MLKRITTLQWIGIVILFNTTLLGGAGQLGDLSLSAGTVKAILAIATLGNGFLGGLVTMFGGQNAMVQSVLDMPGVERVRVNADANPSLAAMAMDPTVNKLSPTDEARTIVAQTARAAG